MVRQIFFLYIIYKNVKMTRAWPILKSNYTLFWSSNFFTRINNKKVTKRRGHGAPLKFFKKWVL